MNNKLFFLRKIAHIVLLVFIYIHCPMLYSQGGIQKYKDSIEKYLYNDSKKTEFYTLKLLELSKKNNNDEDVELAYALYAVIHELRDNIDSTLYYYNKGLSIAKKPQSIYNFKYSIGVIYENEINYDKALLYYKECLELAKKHDMIEGLNRIKTSIATISASRKLFAIL